MVASFSILASLDPEKTAGKSFNVAGQTESWGKKWPIICGYFGLKATGPKDVLPQPGAYIETHCKQWDNLCRVMT